MKFRHAMTGEEREFVKGMKVDPVWKPVIKRDFAKGKLELSEVDPSAITTHKAEKAKKTRAENKRKAENVIEGESVDFPTTKKKSSKKAE